jgi:hypothetical protein
VILAKRETGMYEVYMRERGHEEKRKEVASRKAKQASG